MVAWLCGFGVGDYRGGDSGGEGEGCNGGNFHTGGHYLELVVIVMMVEVVTVVEVEVVMEKLIEEVVVAVMYW